MKLVSSGKGIHSPEFYRKKKKRERFFRIMWLVAFLALIFLAFYLIRHERFLIAEVSVSGEGMVGKGEVALEVKHRLAENYAWFIPKSNFLLYPRRALREALHDEFPTLKSVEFRLNGMNELAVEVAERRPFALYCEESCHFLDESGFIFSPAAGFSNDVYITFHSEVPIGGPIGSNYLPSDEFSSLVLFVESLAPLGIEPVSVKAKGREFELAMPEGGAIMWPRFGDPELVRANLEAFLTNDAIRNQPDFLADISYLDLRTDNKVFYRFRD